MHQSFSQINRLGMLLLPPQSPASQLPGLIHRGRWGGAREASAGRHGGAGPYSVLGRWAGAGRQGTRTEGEKGEAGGGVEAAQPGGWERPRCCVIGSSGKLGL